MHDRRNLSGFFTMVTAEPIHGTMYGTRGGRCCLSSLKMFTPINRERKITSPKPIRMTPGPTVCMAKTAFKGRYCE